MQPQGHSRRLRAKFFSRADPNRKIFHSVREMTAALALLLGFCSGCGAQSAQAPAAPTQSASAKAQDPLNRDTPQSAVVAFLEACHAHDYTRAWRYLDIRDFSSDMKSKTGPQLARQLEQILDRDPQFDIAALSRDPEGDHDDGLPRDRDRVASFTSGTSGGQTLELQLERVTMRSGVPVWLVSSDSVKKIPDIARLTSDTPIEKYLPLPLVSWTIVDTPLWRWIALLLAAIVLAAVSKLLSRFALFAAARICQRLLPGVDRKVGRNALDAFMEPLRLLLAVAGFRAVVVAIEPSALLRLYLDRTLTLLFFVGIAWLCVVVVDLAMHRLQSVLERKHRNFSYSMLPLASRLLKLAILAFTVIAVLADWGYNTTAILAGLGVGGIAVALAAQKTIENLFGGVAVISDRPVMVGDVCKFGDRTGTVEDIGLRSTWIRLPDRTLVSIPNAQFSSMTLENYSRRDKLLFHFTLNLRRDTTPDQLRAVLSSIGATLTKHPKVEKGALPVRFVGVGTYSLDIEVFAYILTLDGDEFLRVQQDLLFALLHAVQAAGTALALPTQASLDYSSPAMPGNPSGTLDPAVPNGHR